MIWIPLPQIPEVSVSVRILAGKGHHTHTEHWRSVKALFITMWAGALLLCSGVRSPRNITSPPGSRRLPRPQGAVCRGPAKRGWGVLRQPMGGDLSAKEAGYALASCSVHPLTCQCCRRFKLNKKPREESSSVPLTHFGHLRHPRGRGSGEGSRPVEDGQ